MNANIIDAIVAGETPSSISQEIKDVLFSKAAERVDDYRTVAAARLFAGDSEEGQGTETIEDEEA